MCVLTLLCVSSYSYLLRCVLILLQYTKQRTIYSVIVCQQKGVPSTCLVKYFCILSRLEHIRFAKTEIQGLGENATNVVIVEGSIKMSFILYSVVTVSG